MNNFSVPYINCHMADTAPAVFIENQVTCPQLAAADGTAARSLGGRGSGNTDSIKFVNGLGEA